LHGVLRHCKNVHILPEEKKRTAEPQPTKKQRKKERTENKKYRNMIRRQLVLITSAWAYVTYVACSKRIRPLAGKMHLHAWRSANLIPFEVVSL
jgi:hypothetical protein